MSIVTTYSQLNLMNLATQKAPDGSYMPFIQVLTKMNQILLDAPWLPANDTFSHRGTRETNLPAGEWRDFNEGVGNEEIHSTPYTENICNLETYAECDKDLCDASPDPVRFRNTRAKRFIEGMNQTFSESIFYGNAKVDSKVLHGFGPRLNTLKTDVVVGGGGTGSDLTSIFIVQWGEERVHFIYPKFHTSFGVDHRDLGEVTLFDAASKKYQGYRDHFKLTAGINVADERCIKRYCNIEATGSTNIFDEDKLIGLLNELPYDGEGAVIYVNQKIKTQMQIALKDKNNVHYAVTDDALSGRPILTFNGCPVRKCDAISITESERS